VICRLWRGWTRAADADAYEAYLREELFPQLRDDEGGRGYRGYDVLRRVDGADVAFVTLVWFDSLESVRGFAGEEYETPVITPRASELLARFDDRALHLEVAASDRIEGA
jgi:hypothetical protein